MNTKFKVIGWPVILALIGCLPIVIWLIADAGLPGTIIARREISKDGNSVEAEVSRWFLRESQEHHIRQWMAVGVGSIWLGILGISIWRMRRRLKKTNTRLQTLYWSSVLVVGVHVFALYLVWLSAGKLMHLGLRLRAERMQEKLALVSQELFNQWPSKLGEYNNVKGLGRVIPIPKQPNRIFVEAPHSPGSFTEGISYCIERNPAGDTLLVLLSSCESSTNRCNAVICRRKDVNTFDQQWLNDSGVDWESRVPLGETMYLATVKGRKPIAEN